MAAAATSDLLEQARSLEVDLGLDDVAVEFEGRSLAEHGRFREDFAPLFDKIRESGRAIGRDLDDLLEFSERAARIE